MIQNCKHRRIKKNYPFGRKSKAFMFCKDCGAIIKGKDLQEKRLRYKKNRKNKKHHTH